MRHFAFSLILVLAVLPVSAQWSAGLGGGYTYNHYDYDVQYMTGMHYYGHHGFNVDATISYQFTKCFGLVSGLSYQQKGYTLIGESNTQQYYPRLRRNDSYIILPILAEFSFGNSKIRWSCDIGVYGGWWLCSVFSYKEIQSVVLVSSYYYHFEKKEFNNDVDRRLEMGGAAGVGVKWIVGPQIGLFANAQCHYAFTTQQKNYQLKNFPSRNITFTTQLGVLYYLKSRNHEHNH